MHGDRRVYGAGRDGDAPHRLTAADSLGGAPLLPGFRLAVADVFAL